MLDLITVINFTTLIIYWVTAFIGCNVWKFELIVKYMIITIYCYPILTYGLVSCRYLYFSIVTFPYIVTCIVLTWYIYKGYF